MKKQKPTVPTLTPRQRAAVISAHMRALGAAGGASTSERKQETARANGAKGGRPRKPGAVSHRKKTPAAVGAGQETGR